MQVRHEQAQAVLGALLESKKGGGPERVRFLHCEEVRDLAEDAPGPIGHPAVQGAVLAGIELLLDHKDFLLDGAEPTTLFAAAGLSLAAINKKLGDILNKLDGIEARLDELKVQLDRIEEKVDRIDIATQEQKLVRALRHALRKHHVGAELAVKDFCKDLVEAMDQFEVVFEGKCLRLGEGLGVRFSVETRDLLEGVYRLLRGLRHAAFSQSNVEVGGDPAQIVVADPIRDYWAADVAMPTAFAARYHLFRHLQKVKREHRQMNDNLFLKSKGRGRWFYRKVLVPAKNNHTSLDGDAVRLERILGGVVMGDPKEFLEALQPYWLWRTSAGLLWRVRREAEGLLADYRPFLGGRELANSQRPLLLAVSADGQA